MGAPGTPMPAGEQGTLRDELLPCSLAAFKQLSSLKLFIADALLDAARSIAWLMHFAGVSKDAAAAQLGCAPIDDIAVQVFEAAFEGRSLADVDAIALHVRTALWMAAFAALPQSAFAQQLDACMHNAAVEQRRKLN